MKRKFKLITTFLYVSFIVPIITIYFLSEVYLYTISNNKHYYLTDGYSWIFIMILIILVLSTFIVISKKAYEIIYYVVGIIIGLLSRFISFWDSSLLFQTLILQYTLIIGYTLLIITLCLSFKFKIVKRDKLA